MTGDATNTSGSGDSARLYPHRLAHGGRGRRRYVVAAILFFLTLMVGAVIGFSIAIVFYTKRPPSPRPDAIGQAMLKRVNEVIKPTPEEATKLEKIVLTHMEAIDKVRKSSWETILDEFADLNVEIGEVVGPERYEKWNEDRKARFGDKRFFHDAETRRHEREKMRGHHGGRREAGETEDAGHP